MHQANIAMNGTPERVLPGQTIATLWRERGFAPEAVVVERNGCAPTPRWNKATPLQPGDMWDGVALGAGG